MPLYDFKCRKEGHVFEKIAPFDHKVVTCPLCPVQTIRLNLKEGVDICVLADQQLPIPASFRFPDMATLNKKRQRIKEPIWRYPDGHIEPVNP